MTEYIECRRCDSPDCKGCNLKRLETMLGNGKFDCLMNENRCINTSADVEPVRHGRWIEPPRLYYGAKQYNCSLCYDKAKTLFGEHDRGVAHFQRATEEEIKLHGIELAGWCIECNKPIEGRWIGMANFCPWCGRAFGCRV